MFILVALGLIYSSEVLGAETKNTDVVVVNGGVGFKNLADRLRLEQYEADNDTEATKKLISRCNTEGTITAIRKGERVIIGIMDRTKNFIQIRRRGEEEEYWISIILLINFAKEK
jgi:hypothetical protein